MVTRSEDARDALAAWAAVHEGDLQRTAYLLTGDLTAARRHVRSVLATLLTSGSEEADDRRARQALRALVGEVTRSAGEVLDRDLDDTDGVADPRRTLVRDFLGTLTPRRRAALVLRLHLHLGAGEVSALVGGTPAEVADDVAALLDDLAGLLAVSAVEAARVATETLAVWAGATPVAMTSLDDVRTDARRRRARRTRRGLLLAGAALVVVAVPVATLSGGGLPTPPPTPPGPTPVEAPSYGPEDRVPPPWVLPSESQTYRLLLRSTCSNPINMELRSTTTMRAGCRTLVIRPR